MWRISYNLFGYRRFVQGQSKNITGKNAIRSYIESFGRVFFVISSPDNPDPSLLLWRLSSYIQNLRRIPLWQSLGKDFVHVPKLFYNSTHIFARMNNRMVLKRASKLLTMVSFLVRRCLRKFFLFDFNGKDSNIFIDRLKSGFGILITDNNKIFSHFSLSFQ